MNDMNQQAVAPFGNPEDPISPDQVLNPDPTLQTAAQAPPMAAQAPPMTVAPEAATINHSVIPANPQNAIETQQDIPFTPDSAAIPMVEQPIINTVSTPPITHAPTPQSTTPLVPSEVDGYTPLEVQRQLADITPGKFDNLTKVLDILKQGKPTAITIKSSFIHENINGAVLVADVNTVFDNTVDFEITDPKKHIDLFKQFKGNNNIFILDDPENVRFILTNGPIKIFLPKQLDQLVAETTPPDIQNATLICRKIVSKEVRDDIKGLGKHATSIEYLIQGGQIKAMHIPDTGIYRFNEFIKDPEVAKLDETNAELVLKSEIFLPVDSDQFDVRIVQKPDTQEYISVTECNAGIIKMWIYEQLENTTGGSIQF